MKKRPTVEYIWFGAAMRFLQNARPANLVHGEGNVLPNMEAVITWLPRLSLHVSERALVPSGFTAMRDELAATAQDETLGKGRSEKLREVMQQLWTTVAAESGGVYAFVVSDKRINVTKLLEDVPSLFGPGVFQDLPDTAQVDYEQAGRCVAFELPTAAAFHLMRGTEALLRQLYCAIVKRKRLDPLMWGPMVAQLRERHHPPPKALLDHLDSIRVNFRNPTQHPDAVYDIHEAQDLFSICIDVANRTMRALPD